MNVPLLYCLISLTVCEQQGCTVTYHSPYSYTSYAKFWVRATNGVHFLNSAPLKNNIFHTNFQITFCDLILLISVFFSLPIERPFDFLSSETIRACLCEREREHLVSPAEVTDNARICDYAKKTVLDAWFKLF